MKKTIILLLAAGILSCNGGEPETNELLDILAVLDAEQSAWEASGISDYQFTAEDFHAKPLTYTITIRTGTEPEITHTPYNEREQEWWEEFKTSPEWTEWTREKMFFPLRGPTIDNLYPSMREAAVMYASDDKKNVEIRYNKEYHYPEKFHSWPSKTGVDGGSYRFTIKEFKVLGSSEAGN